MRIKIEFPIQMVYRLPRCFRRVDSRAAGCGGGAADSICNVPPCMDTHPKWSI